MSKMPRFFFCIALFSFSLLASSLTIVNQGKANAVIVQGNPSPLCELAVHSLQEAIKGCSGINLEIIAPEKISDLSEDTVRLIVGDCEYARKLGYSSKKLELEEYLIQAKGKDIFLLGHNREDKNYAPKGGPQPPHPTLDFRRYSSADLWSVTEFVDRIMGVRYLWPGKLGSYYPAQATIQVPLDFKLQRRPFYQVRHLWFYGPDYRPASSFYKTHEYMMRHQQGLRQKTWFTHGFSNWWSMYHEKEPTLFALNPNGERGFINQPHCVKFCISNPRVAELMLDAWRKAGKPELWTFCPNDGAGYCTCEKCRQLDGQENNKFSKKDIWTGKASMTRRYLIFWNKMMKIMRQENPNVQCCVFGYGAYKECPPDIKLEPGFLVAIVPPDFVPNGEGIKVWNGWKQSGAKLLLRPNWLHTFFFMPYYPLKSVHRFLQQAKDCCFGFEQDCILGAWAMQGPYYYMLARLSWRDDLSVEAVKKEYASAFGSAAPEILQWIQYWENFTDKVQGGTAEEENGNPGGLYAKVCRTQKHMRANSLYGTWDTLPFIYTPEVFAPAIALLKKAEQKTINEPIAHERVLFLQKGLNHSIKTVEVLTLWLKEPTGRTKEYWDSYLELLKMRVPLRDEMVINADYLNRCEWSRYIHIQPMNPDGSWKKRRPTTEEAQDLTDYIIKYGKMPPEPEK